MTVYFRDVFGKGGKISDSLGVDYSGHWEEEVEDFVEEMKVMYAEDEEIRGLDVVNHLLIELPDVAPIREVRRGNATI